MASEDQPKESNKVARETAEETTVQEGAVAVGPEDRILEDLVILPPRQKSSTLYLPLKLPPISAEEPIQSLRAALLEVVGYAHLTRYRLELEVDAKHQDTPSDSSLTCWTGPDAVIQVAKIVDEFLPIDAPDGSAFRVVLEQYTLQAVLDHVHRLRILLQGNAPSRTQLVPSPLTSPDNKPRRTDLPQLPDVPVTVPTTNLQNFFHHALGESPPANLTKNGKRKKKKKKKKPDVVQWNKLDEVCFIDCQIEFSAFHPPPNNRKFLGDLAYLTVKLPQETLHITASILGFYVNQCTDTSFDPSPVDGESCFAHALLDTLLQASEQFKTMWEAALAASSSRQDILRTIGNSSWQCMATRGDFDGFSSPGHAAKICRDAVHLSSSSSNWLVPSLHKFPSWNGHSYHTLDSSRRDASLVATYGLEWRMAARDWNEELQMAREMPTDNLLQRLDRARLLYKLLSEFGDAAQRGVVAVVEGRLVPMNPGDAMCVYLFNGIFISQAVDVADGTFRISSGDRAARKTANRDVQSIGTLHRRELKGVYTLATVLVDYLGGRYICQSVLPGILTGERSHTLIHGSVDKTAPMTWDAELQESLDSKIGVSLMIASRPVLKSPMESMIANAENADEVIEATCLPLEAKAIRGSDQRTYLLELGRLTPRDANWIPQSQGGTGRLESTSDKRLAGFGPDDELAAAVLRSELINRYAQQEVSQAVQKKEQEQEEARKASKGGSDNEKEDKGEAKPENVESNKESKEEKLSKEELEALEAERKTEGLKHLQSLRMNLNAFIPNMRSFDGINEEYAKQIKDDEDLLRSVAEFLWDNVLPGVTMAIRDGSVHQIPVDGRSLTEFLHQQGINCRYLGRLATLAIAEEKKDKELEQALGAGKSNIILRKQMPLCWLELLEIEMIARAAKHVLDDYLSENGGSAATRPAQTVASFLSALVSIDEETAAQTETYIERLDESKPDNDDVGALTICDVGGGGDAVVPAIRGRDDVWNDIEKEVARRFRYVLTLYNIKDGKGTRESHIPLLRRVCQRSGVRLVAKDYDLGAKCFCGGSTTLGGRLILSRPISPLDVADIVPLVKHAASHHEGFTPCAIGSSSSQLSLHVSLQDARALLQRAHILAGSKQLVKAIDLAQEAASLYQRVTDSSSHPGVIECIKLIAEVLLEGGDPLGAVSSGTKALALTIQSSGYDSAATLSAHTSLFAMMFAAHEMDVAVKHIRAAIFLLEHMCGPRHTDHHRSFHKLGTLYSYDDYEGKYLESALKFFQEAQRRESSDRLMNGILAKSSVKVLESLEKYKDALVAEKEVFRTMSTFLGSNHQLTKESDQALRNLTKLAVEKGAKELADQAAAKLDPTFASQPNDDAKKAKK